MYKHICYAYTYMCKHFCYPCLYGANERLRERELLFVSNYRTFLGIGTLGDAAPHSRSVRLLLGDTAHAQVHAHAHPMWAHVHTHTNTHTHTHINTYTHTHTHTHTHTQMHAHAHTHTHSMRAHHTAMPHHTATPHCHITLPRLKPNPSRTHYTSGHVNANMFRRRRLTLFPSLSLSLSHTQNDPADKGVKKLSNEGVNVGF